MRILLTTPFFPPDISGAGRYLADLSEAAVERGHEVRVLHLGERATAHRTASGVAVEPVHAPVRGGSLALATVRALTEHHRRGVDLMVAGVAHPTGFPVALASRVTRTPLLTMVHSEELCGASHAVGRRLLGFTFRSSEQVVAVSRWSRHGAIAAGAHPDRARVVHPAIDPTPYLERRGPGHREAARRGFGIDGRVLLTVGRLEDRKGHDVVLQAMAALGPDFDDVTYLVVGSGDPTRIEDLGRRLGLHDRIRVVGGVRPDQLRDAYGAADVFVMASREGADGAVEGFGMVYLEAAASGLPCVAGNRGGCADAIEDGRTGLLVDPTRPTEVAGALATLLSRPETADQMGRRGRERVCSTFDRPDFKRSIGDLLEAAAGLAPCT
jgi:phosphatidylinositol alpha-1,6-mannosyltransferase